MDKCFEFGGVCNCVFDVFVYGGDFVVNGLVDCYDMLRGYCFWFVELKCDFCYGMGS